MALTEQQVMESLKPIEDPELHLGIVDLGLIYGVEVQDAPEGANVQVNMTLTSPACPYGPMLLAGVHSALAKIPGIKDVDVDLVFIPGWDPRAMATEEAKELLGLY